MKIPVLGLITITALLNTVAVKAQTADEIISKHIDAIGGKDKISLVKSLYLEGNLQVMGNEVPTTTYVINGKALKNEINFNGSKIIQVVTDKSGWAVNPMQGQTEPTPLPTDQLKAAQEELDLGGQLLNYTAKGAKVELLGKEDVNGNSTFKIKVTAASSTVTTYFIDATTYYIDKSVTVANVGGQTAETSSTYSDYKKTDIGFVIPYKTELTLPQGLSLTTVITKAELNKEIDPAIFELPKK